VVNNIHKKRKKNPFYISERLTANAPVATVLGSIPASVGKSTVEPFCVFCEKGTVEPFCVLFGKGTVEPFCVLYSKDTMWNPLVLCGKGAVEQHT
jgi:hypothetical protein